MSLCQPSGIELQMRQGETRDTTRTVTHTRMTHETQQLILNKHIPNHPVTFALV
jgi:hypothetical protein